MEYIEPDTTLRKQDKAEGEHSAWKKRKKQLFNKYVL